MLGWLSAGGVGTWWIIGKIFPPGAPAQELTMRGGSIRMTSRDGTTGLLYFGDFGDGSRGWAFSFVDGSTAFFSAGTPDAPIWVLRDSSGNNVVRNDGASGVGLARPYLNYRLVPSSSAHFVGEGTGSGWPSTTNTTATKMLQGINTVWHPRVSVGVGTLTTGGGSANWRLEINGVDVTGTISGSGTQTVNVPGWGTTIQPGAAVGFDVFGWAAGGATRAWFQCDRLYGLQS
jgi:hypothetical protein